MGYQSGSDIISTYTPSEDIFVADCLCLLHHVPAGHHEDLAPPGIHHSLSGWPEGPAKLKLLILQSRGGGVGRRQGLH